MDIPEPPTYDDISQQIIQTFVLTDRGRRYIEGQPMPLTVRDITDVLTAHPIGIPRSMLDYIIFALDEIALSERQKIKDKPDNT